MLHLEPPMSENKSAKYYIDNLSYMDNVSNKLAEDFYKSHGVKSIQSAIEVMNKTEMEKTELLMTTRYCVRKELGICKKDNNDSIKEPLKLRGNNILFVLDFDCKNCEMLVKKSKSQS